MNVFLGNKSRWKKLLEDESHHTAFCANTDIDIGYLFE